MVTQESKDEEKQANICPRCGRKIDWYEKHKIGNRVYVYAVHYLGYENGKYKYKKCYLGPLDSYKYVSKTHEREGLLLYGALHEERSIDYLEILLDTLPSIAENKIRKEPETARKITMLAEKMRAVSDELLKIANT
jgi:hypothetical protein